MAEEAVGAAQSLMRGAVSQGRQNSQLWQFAAPRSGPGAEQSAALRSAVGGHVGGQDLELLHSSEASSLQKWPALC